MKPRIAFERWEDLLQRAVLLRPGPLQRVKVVAQTDSTQDAARRMGAQAGDVIVAGRQTNGRGRLGRAWADTGYGGVAVTMAVNRGRPERLAIASAVATCSAIQATCRNKAIVHIKWPNDIMCGHYKMAGILIEQFDDLALIGVGINVRQTQWPADIAERALSIVLLGVRATRLRVTLRLLLAMQISLTMSDERLSAEFANRDGLCGMRASFLCNGKAYAGKVLRVDPMRGLAVLTDTEGEVWLPAATTTVINA
jgi:biotin-[acetyl-CoA-carboxylase] ligase BirA-like protein